MTNEHYFSATPKGPLIPREISVRLVENDYRLFTAGGVFSPDHVDTGTQVLLANVPKPPETGQLLDLGCGWGPIALSLAIQSPDATIWAVDVNERALELVRMNASRLGITNINAVLAEDVPDEVSFATLWSNPPIRIGKNELHTLLTTWLPRLEPGSAAWLVVQRNLGSDSLYRWLQEEYPTEFEVTKEAIGKGYRVLRALRGAGDQAT